MAAFSLKTFRLFRYDFHSYLILGPQGLLGASRQWSDDLDPEIACGFDLGLDRGFDQGLNTGLWLGALNLGFDPGLWPGALTRGFYQSLC